MRIRHILVATDESDTARNALRAALVLAHRASARVTVLTTVPAFAPVGAEVMLAGAGRAPDTGRVLASLEQWMDVELGAGPAVDSVGLGVTFGIPGVEICRFADEHDVDLIVVGRKRRSQATRLLIGDTADAVARRSGVPCLFVPLGSGAPTRLLVALDGSRRGAVVLRTACEFADSIRCELWAVTVEAVRQDEPAELASCIPTGLSRALEATIAQLAECRPGDATPNGLIVRRGPIVETLLTVANETGADAIAVGFHRGGPPGVIEAGSTARHLTHTATCPILTVPL